MSSGSNSLDALRREIDAIDDALHDLLMKRAEVVDAIREAKGGRPIALHPGREAAILRRLAARHSGKLSTAVLTRMWRELLAGMTRLQGPFAIAVSAPEHNRVMWDLARDHFGSTTPINAVSVPLQAIRAVIDGTATIAIVPWPDSEDRTPWWLSLLPEDSKTPNVVARLPFLVPAEGGEEQVALALATIPHEPTGEDHTLITIELEEAISRSRLKETLEGCRLPPSAFWSAVGQADASRMFQLVEIDDFVGDADERLQDLTAKLGPACLRAKPIGGFALPIRLPPEPSDG